MIENETNSTDASKAQSRGQYVYIVQASAEPAKCKIGVTDDLERRLKDYNSMTGKSTDNLHAYLFTCAVKNMRKVEEDIKGMFYKMREMGSREIYFYKRRCRFL